MSGEEPCVRGAASDRSLRLALSVTSGTQRPLGSAGVSNYMLLSLTHTHTCTHTLHEAQCWRMRGRHLTERGHRRRAGGAQVESYQASDEREY